MLKEAGLWKTMCLRPQCRRGRTTTEAEEMRYTMGIADKVRGENGRWTIAAAEMWENGDIRDEDTGKLRRRQRQRHGMGDSRYARMTEIAVLR